MVLCYFGEEDLGDLPSNLSLVTNHLSLSFLVCGVQQLKLSCTEFIALFL